MSFPKNAPFPESINSFGGVGGFEIPAIPVGRHQRTAGTPGPVPRGNVPFATALQVRHLSDNDT